MEGYQRAVGEMRMGSTVQGLRSINGGYKIDRRRLRQRTGEGKELKCMIHGHELRWRNDGGKGSAGQREIKGRKKWDNCNSIINKIYLKKEFN